MTIRIQTEMPGPKSRALMQRRRAHVARGPFHVTPLFAARAKGAVIEDVDGNVLIDFAAGIGVANVGHSAEGVLGAIRAQSENYLHLGFNVTPYEGYVELCEKLNQAVPGDFEKKSFLANSGAEAVENAIKIARAFTGRQAIICFEHAFHGRTYMAMSLTAKARYKQGFAPFNPEVYRVPYPYAYRSNQGGHADFAVKEAFQKFVEQASVLLSPTDVAAVIIEPVLGEGGFVPAPKEFLGQLREYCSRHGIVLIADEIQTGFGRTGTFFACEQLGLVPDLITTAKGLGGGLPISAVTGRSEIMDAPVEGAIGGTYGGHPMACAAALAVFEAMEAPEFFERTSAIGKSLRDRLLAWQKAYPFIGDVRGIGPMQAMELVKDRASKEPAAELAKQLIQISWQRGVILMSAGTYGNVIRFLMPLTIDDDDLNEGLTVIEANLKELYASWT